jgi:hypothetical protein
VLPERALTTLAGCLGSTMVVCFLDGTFVRRFQLCAGCWVELWWHLQAAHLQQVLAESCPLHCRASKDPGTKPTAC